MPRVPAPLRQAVFVALALLTALFFQVRGQAEGFTFRSHRFVIDPCGLLLSAAILYILLAGLWALSATALARTSRLPYRPSAAGDFWTWLPLVFLALTPLALKHYLTRGDLLDRFGLWLAAVLFAVLYLKAAQWRAVGRTRPMAWTPLVRKFLAWEPRRKLPILFLAAVAAGNAGSLIMSFRGVTAGGDEPHYLIVTQSLLRDGDFDVSNNYEARGYSAYLPPQVVLSPHTVPGAKPGSQYSFHSPGVSIYLIPFYALGSLFGGAWIIALARFGMSLIGALFGLQVYLFARKEFGREPLALGLWFLMAFTSPVYFYSIHIYPEIFAALFSFFVFRSLRDPAKLTRGRLILCGALLPGLIWFHSLKYLLLAAPLGLLALWVLWKKRSAIGDWVALLAPAAAVGALYFGFQAVLYGSLNPTSVSWQGAMGGAESMAFLKQLLTGIPFRFRLETLAGYFFDQRDGLLFYAPVYAFAFLGLVEMFKRKAKAALLVLAVAAPYIFVSAMLTQRTGYAPQARPLVAVIWAPAVFCGYYLAAKAKKIFSLLFHGAAALSLLFVYLLLRNPTALYQETTQGTIDRGGELFAILSNLHHSLAGVLPSFLKVEDWHWTPNFVWPALLAVFVGLYALARRPASRISTGGHMAIAGVFLAGFFGWFVSVPRLMLYSPRPVVLDTGDRLTFYSLSRVARMHAPARFALLEDGRDYDFYFLSPRRIRKLRADFGSDKGDYDLELGFFDEKRDAFPTRRTLDTRTFEAPPAYRWKRRFLYRISIHLEKRSDVRTGINPYQFAIQPVR